jgi:hypothetical protein
MRFFRRSAVPKLFALPFTLSLLLPFAVGCDGPPPEPESFSRGQAIPIASWTIKVSRVEVLSAQAIPSGTIQLLQSGDKLVAVHIGIEFPGSPEDVAGEFPRLLRSVRLEDDSGQSWRFRSAPLTEAHWRVAKSGNAYGLQDLEGWMNQMRSGQFLKSWVLTFFVPQESSGFTFFIDNYAPTDDQPRLAAIDLGR